MLAYGSNNSIIIYNIDTFQEITTLNNHSSTILSVYFSKSEKIYIKISNNLLKNKFYFLI